MDAGGAEIDAGGADIDAGGVPTGAMIACGGADGVGRSAEDESRFCGTTSFCMIGRGGGGVAGLGRGVTAGEGARGTMGVTGVMVGRGAGDTPGRGAGGTVGLAGNAVGGLAHGEFTGRLRRASM